MIVEQMTVGKMIVRKMIVGKMTVGQIIVGQRTHWEYDCQANEPHPNKATTGQQDFSCHSTTIIEFTRQIKDEFSLNL